MEEGPVGASGRVASRSPVGSRAGADRAPGATLPGTLWHMPMNPGWWSSGRTVFQSCSAHFAGGTVISIGWRVVRTPKRRFNSAGSFRRNARRVKHFIPSGHAPSRHPPGSAPSAGEPIMKPNATCVIVSGHTLTAADVMGDPDALADIREAGKTYARATSSAELKPSVAPARNPGGDAYQLVVTPSARRRSPAGGLKPSRSRSSTSSP